jgi:hypothetical protein
MLVVGTTREHSRSVIASSNQRTGAHGFCRSSEAGVRCAGRALPHLARRSAGTGEGSPQQLAPTRLCDRRDVFPIGLLGDRFLITRMNSHVDDLAPNGEGLFSRDCPEYEVALPGGKSLLVLVDHRKSKGYGTQGQQQRQTARTGHARGRDLLEPAQGRLEAGRGGRRPQRHARRRSAGPTAERHRPQGRLSASGIHPGRAHSSAR